MKIIRTAQQGSVLIFCLVMLLALTIVGTSGFNQVTLDEKISSNLRDKQVASQRAEIGLRAGEVEINQMTSVPVASISGDVWPMGDAGGNSGALGSAWVLDKDEQWWVDNTDDVSTTSDTYYFIEFQEFKGDSLSFKNSYNPGRPGVYYYRVTAKAEGEGAGTAVLQSTYGKRFN